MKIRAALSIAVLGAFVGLSAAGLATEDPAKPFLRIDPCYAGYKPVLAFGASRRFTVNHVNLGKDVFPSDVYYVGWPGGLVGIWITPKCF